MCMQNVPCSSWLLDTVWYFNLFDLHSSDQAISARELAGCPLCHYTSLEWPFFHSPWILGLVSTFSTVLPFFFFFVSRLMIYIL